MPAAAQFKKGRDSVTNRAWPGHGCTLPPPRVNASDLHRCPRTGVIAYSSARMDDTWNDADLRYAEWFSWAKREVSGDERVCHGVAAAALEALQRGASRDEVQKVARASVLGRVAVLATEAPPDRRGYAQ